METLVLEFAACCRAGGMRVSTAEVLDCLSGLDIFNNLDEHRFFIILRANFAKSRRDQAAFERLYTLFFKKGKKEYPSTTSEAQPFNQSHDEPDENMVSMLDFNAMAKDPGTTDQDHAVIQMLNGNPRLFIAAVRNVLDQEINGGQAVKSNLGQLTGRLGMMLAIRKIQHKAVQFIGDPDAQVALSDRRRIVGLVEQRCENALTFLNEDVRVDNDGLRTPGPGDIHYPDIGRVPFANLTGEQLVRVQEVADQWVRKFNDMSTLRYAASRKGLVDFKRTIRRSGRYLGVPVDIVRKDRPPARGKIVALCDVSGSVWSTARFMLTVLYSLQVCFARVKSYVFIDQPLEVSDYFLTHDPNAAIKKIMQDKRINYNARTDYGLMFQRFRDQHLADLDKKTTLILMGDGRSNYHNPREPVLDAMRERCRRLVWLNPEQERFWGTGDSEMFSYRQYCNQARACGNLNQLIDFIRDLITATG